MKQSYTRPTLVEYGSVTELTLGSGGTKPDYVFTGSALDDTDTNCSDTGTTYACLVS